MNVVGGAPPADGDGGAGGASGAFFSGDAVAPGSARAKNPVPDQGENEEGAADSHQGIRKLQQILRTQGTVIFERGQEPEERSEAEEESGHDEEKRLDIFLAAQPFGTVQMRMMVMTMVRGAPPDDLGLFGRRCLAGGSVRCGGLCARGVSGWRWGGVRHLG